MGNLFKISIINLSFAPLWLCVIVDRIYQLLQHNKFNILNTLLIISIVLLMTLSILVVIQSFKSIQPSEYQVYKIKKARRYNSFFNLYNYYIILNVQLLLLVNSVHILIMIYIFIIIILYKNDSGYDSYLFGLKGYHLYECKLTAVAGGDIERLVFSKIDINAEEGNTVHIAGLNKPFAVIKDKGALY